MNGSPGKTLEYYPIIGFFIYWLYSCPIGAIVSGDPRLLKLGIVNVPLLLIGIASIVKIRRGGQAR